MFFHGIPFVHLTRQFPLLAPRRAQPRKSPSQREDARHFVRMLGFEPVHLLRSTRGYPAGRCVKECLNYGDTVLAFSGLPFPRVQLSRHEWGVPGLDCLDAVWVVTRRIGAEVWLKKHLPGVPVYFLPPGERGRRQRKKEANPQMTGMRNRSGRRCIR